MANLSKIKREKMLDYLEKLKEINNDDENIRAITEIENALNEKKYGLVWEEHSEKVDEMLEHNIPIFVEDKERKIVINEEAYNFLLEGDNLHSLKLLEKTHKGKIDLIYIDPPYNTGEEDFRYDDNYVDVNDTFRHSKWLSFMSERLKIANKLLSSRGFIFISIDDKEASTLRLLCDDIFGESNYEKTDYIKVRYLEKTLKSDMKYHKEIEQVLVYKKSDVAQPYIKPEAYDYGKFVYSIEELASGSLMELGGKKVVLFKDGEYKITKSSSGYKNGLKEVWATGTILNGNSSGRFFRDYLAGRKTLDGLGVLYKVYDIGDDQYQYRYFTGPKKSNATKGKYYQGVPVNKMEDGSEKITPIPNFYDMAGDFGNIRHEGKVSFNSGKKPIKMIRRFIEYFEQKDICVLDFFAGSGTTGHAVMQLNKEDGGNRKYILCTNNENNICEEVTYQRLKNIQEELPHNLKYYKTEFIRKFSDGEESISDKMMEHIRELIELEYAIELDGKKHIILDGEDELDESISKIENGGKLFVRSGIFLSRSNQRILEEKGVSVIEIPEYYFREELKEVGEL